MMLQVSGSGSGSGSPSHRVAQMTLHRIIGTTAQRNSALSTNPENGDVAYTAGAVVVLVRPSLVTNEQAAYLTTPHSKPVSCVAFSPNGKYLAAGEVGHQPTVVVWELATQKVVAELRGHKFGIDSLCWAPTGQHLASVGFEQDGTLSVWSWRSGTLVGTKPLPSRVCSVASLADGTFVTSGERHLKFWKLRRPKAGSKVTAMQLEGSSAVLGAERNSTYASVIGGQAHSDRAFAYGLSSRGLLCLFNADRTIERYVNVKPGETGQAFATAASSRCIAVGCSDGIVRLFAPKTLQYIATLPKPAACGRQNVDKVDRALSLSTDAGDEVFPDAVCVSLSDDGNHLSVIYSDHSLYVWDIADTSNIGKYRSYLSHAGCVWDVERAPASSPMPASTFVTSSADSTIRFWNIAGHETARRKAAAPAGKGQEPRNAYSRDIVSMIYCGGTTGAAFAAWKASGEAQAREKEHNAEIRCLRISPDGRHLASGDRMGNVRVHELDAGSHQLYAFHEAHDSEVLSLDFSPELKTVGPEEATPRVLLASAGRDSLVHIFDSATDYHLAKTAGDHNAAVTGLRFAQDPADEGSCRLMTCSADKSIAFRSVTPTSAGNSSLSIYRCHQSKVPSGSLHTLAVTSDGKYTVTAGGDQNADVKVWDSSNGKLARTIKIDGKAEPIKVVMDPSDTLMAVCSSDRGIRLYDFGTGELHYKVRGHSEVVTGMTFSADGSELVTVSADSCIFVWKIGSDLRRVIRHRLLSQRAAEERRSRSNTDVRKSGVDTEAVKDSTKPSSARPREVPALPLEKLKDEPAEKEADDSGVINLSNTLTPGWARDASIEVPHRTVKSARSQQAAGGGPTSARSESDASSTTSEGSSRWAEDVQTDLFADPSTNSPVPRSPAPSSPAPGNWDDVTRSRDHASPIVARDTAEADGVKKPGGGKTPVNESGDGPSLLMDDMVMCDISDEEDGGVVYFGGQDAADAAAAAEQFEVTQSVSAPEGLQKNLLDKKAEQEEEKDTEKADAEDEQEKELVSTQRLVAADSAATDAANDCSLPTWLSAEVPSSAAWAANANCSMRQSFSSKYRAQAKAKPAVVPPSPPRLTLKQERAALKKAEQEAARSSSSEGARHSGLQLSARGIGMSLLSPVASAERKSAGNGATRSETKEVAGGCDSGPGPALPIASDSDVAETPPKHADDQKGDPTPAPEVTETSNAADGSQVQEIEDTRELKSEVEEVHEPSESQTTGEPRDERENDTENDTETETETARDDAGGKDEVEETAVPSESTLSTLSLPAMPDASEEEGDGDDGGDEVKTDANGEKEEEHEEHTKDDPQHTSEEATPEPAAEATQAELKPEETKQESHEPQEGDEETKEAEVPNDARHSSTREDEAAARAKMEKVVQRMTTEFETELAAADQRAALAKEQAARELQAEREKHAATTASAAAAAAAADSVRADLEKEVGRLKELLAAAQVQAAASLQAQAQAEARCSAAQAEAKEAAVTATKALSALLID